ncbi:hypothetical protein AAUPMC_10612, partial [Pasteurella multocida subsp. multocida str. Anand1_cattle]
AVHFLNIKILKIEKVMKIRISVQFSLLLFKKVLKLNEHSILRTDNVPQQQRKTVLYSAHAGNQLPLKMQNV